MRTVTIGAIPAIDGYYYLATPFSKFAGGLHAAYEAACREAAKLRAAGRAIYCPIETRHEMELFSAAGKPVYAYDPE